MDAFWIILFILVLLWTIPPKHPGGRDDTDEVSKRGRRSGMILYTDYLTGLQYLGNPLGGITPRLDAEGNHMRAGIDRKHS